MPGIVLRTNVKISAVRELVSELSSLCATTLGKPESYISVQYAYDEHLMFAGTFDPTAMLSVMSLDNINPEANERYCAVLFPFLQEKLGVPSDRAYISFDDPGRANLGYSGTTFSVLWREK